jgi:hypothetical protein
MNICQPAVGYMSRPGTRVLHRVRVVDDTTRYARPPAKPHEAWVPVQRPGIGGGGEKTETETRCCRDSTTRTAVGPPRIRYLWPEITHREAAFCADGRNSSHARAGTPPQSRADHQPPVERKKRHHTHYRMLQQRWLLIDPLVFWGYSGSTTLATTNHSREAVRQASRVWTEFQTDPCGVEALSGPVT